MKRLIAVVTAVLAACSIQSGAEPWKITVDSNLTLAQNAYSDNWAGGEAGALSWAATSNSLAEKQLSPVVHNRNTLKLQFGQTLSQDKTTREWAKPAKSSDLIDFESLFRMTLGGFVDPYASVRVETQFIDTSDPAINRWLNPVQYTESAGIARTLIKQGKRELSTRFGAALKQRQNREVLNAATAAREDIYTRDGGFLSVTDFTSPLADEKMTFTSKLSIFKALYSSESDRLKGLPNENYWQDPDVNWENTLSVSITKYIMVNLTFQVLYDKEVDPVMRLKENLGLGVTYKLDM